MRDYDAIIIGTGQAGSPLAGRMNSEGLRVAIIERGKLGGTCVNVGCIPTKTLVASARAAYVARRAAEYGVEIGGEVRVDMKVVKARMKAISGESNASIASWIAGMERVDLFRGHARFESTSTVRVGDVLLRAPKIFINVGGRARVPDWPGVTEVPYLTNVSMMENDVLPEHLIILGGGYIGLEFAQMYRRFGSRVTVIEHNAELLRREDRDVAEAIGELLTAEGVRLAPGTDVTALARTASGGVRVETSRGGVEEVVEGSHVLLAVGRVPNTEDLGLEAAGIDVNKRGFITVDDRLMTNVEGVYALGDCNGKGAFTHTAYNDYEIVAANLFDDDARRVSDRHVCYGLFIDPPLGRIGLTEAQARASDRDVLIGTRPMSRVGRARERGETQGFMKILVDAQTERIIGASILGVNGDEVVQTLLALMYADAPYTTLSRSVPIHPTVAELLPTVLQGLKPLE